MSEKMENRNDLMFSIRGLWVRFGKGRTWPENNLPAGISNVGIIRSALILSDNSF